MFALNCRYVSMFNERDLQLYELKCYNLALQGLTVVLLFLACFICFLANVNNEIKCLKKFTPLSLIEKRAE